MTNTTLNTKNKQAPIVIALLILLFVVEVIAIYRVYATRVLGVADFQPRWYGARALLLDGRDPYSEAVTREIEEI